MALDSAAEPFNFGTFLFYLQHHLLGDLQDKVKESRPGTFRWYTKWDSESNQNKHNPPHNNNIKNQHGDATHQCVFLEVIFSYNPDGELVENPPQAPAETSSDSSETTSLFSCLSLRFGFVVMALQDGNSNNRNDVLVDPTDNKEAFHFEVPFGFQALHKTLVSDIDISDTEDNPMWIFSNHLSTILQDLSPSDIWVQQQQLQQQSSEGDSGDDGGVSPLKFKVSLPLQMNDICLDAKYQFTVEKGIGHMKEPLLSSFREGKQHGMDLLAEKRQQKQKRMATFSSQMSQSQGSYFGGFGEKDANDHDSEEKKKEMDGVWAQALKRAAVRRKRAKQAAAAAAAATAAASAGSTGTASGTEKAVSAGSISSQPKRKKQFRVPVPVKRARAGTRKLK